MVSSILLVRLKKYKRTLKTKSRNKKTKRESLKIEIRCFNATGSEEGAVLLGCSISWYCVKEVRMIEHPFITLSPLAPSCTHKSKRNPAPANESEWENWIRRKIHHGEVCDERHMMNAFLIWTNFVQVENVYSSKEVNWRILVGN